VEVVEGWWKSLIIRHTVFAGEIRHDLLAKDDFLQPEGDRRSWGLGSAGKGILEVELNHFFAMNHFLAMATLLDFRLLSKKYKNVLTNK
jgi:hypothetical protein